MTTPTSPHDKFFRASMQYTEVAQAFFQHYLPEDIRQALDMSSLKLEANGYLDEELQESFSDLVFRCSLAGEEAYLTLLVEHQSSPDKFLPVRVYHYLFSFLHQRLKDRPRTLLPAVYALVFYHGEQTPYPYSLHLDDCFNDPLGLMKRLFTEAIPLIDVNQLSEAELKRQSWVGYVARTLKHIRDQDMGAYAQELWEDMSALELDQHPALGFLLTLLKYVISTANINDVSQFLNESLRRLPAPIGGELMTIAEQLEALGKEKGRAEGEQKGRAEGEQKGRVEGRVETTEMVAINLLREGTEPSFVAKITGLTLTTVLQLRERLTQK